MKRGVRVFGANVPIVLPNRGGGGVAWSPLDVPNLRVWIDFSDASTLFTDDGATPVRLDQDAIYRVNDKSGNGSHLSQGTLASRPAYRTNVLNGRSVARFDSADYVTRATLTTGVQSQPLTIFAVGSTTVTAATYAMIAIAGTGALPYLAKVPAHSFLLAGDGGNGPADGVNDQTPRILAGNADGANSRLWDGGGTPGGPTSTGTQTWTGLRLGMNSDGTTYPWTGDIAEVLLYSGNLTTDNMNLLGRYLALKYGLTWVNI